MGCVIYEALTLKPPFQAEDMGGLFKKVQKGQYSKIPRHYSSDLSQLIKLMVQVKQDHRPTCDSLLSMPLIQKKCKQFFPHLMRQVEQE
mmetsp:Transcript_3729/g.2786  ORF Transcript_3729/g.2786 Transcript_3729/m.2786 type:complete len:89 (+) Transcript_3729:109-375(+)